MYFVLEGNGALNWVCIAAIESSDEKQRHYVC